MHSTDKEPIPLKRQRPERSRTWTALTVEVRALNPPDGEARMDRVVDILLAERQRKLATQGEADLAQAA